MIPLNRTLKAGSIPSMQTECPHCKKRFDVSIKTVLDWIGRSTKLRSAVQRLFISKAIAGQTPESQRRDVDYAALARKSHAQRRENRGQRSEDSEQKNTAAK